jgi:hypothetical protein
VPDAGGAIDRSKSPTRGRRIGATDGVQLDRKVVRELI